ncbi:hypothetical protein [Taibaiella koreensis]|uniref:hypothetical protein n=1 Tax=Taibaiella koreensis TaxID=1268548 RepID=UPI000E59EF0C|nr:hypothetical protein [Taibaiella koreensis]
MTNETFIRIFPMACAWAKQQESWILDNGVPLNEDQQIDAYLAGVKAIEKVRLWYADRAPEPALPELKAATERLGLLWSGTAGTTFRYGIFIRNDRRHDRSLVVHELVHTMQYERMGGFEPFLEQYLKECLTVGYPDGALEQEARLIEQRLCR